MWGVLAKWMGLAVVIEIMAVIEDFYQMENRWTVQNPRVNRRHLWDHDKPAFWITVLGETPLRALDIPLYACVLFVVMMIPFDPAVLGLQIFVVSFYRPAVWMLQMIVGCIYLMGIILIQVGWNGFSSEMF